MRCGGDVRLAVLDADDKHDARTSANLTRYLAGLGLDAGDYPLVATPANGRHFYATLGGNLPDNYRTFKAELGAGELRYGKGAYIGAPPSIIGASTYRLLSGDFRTLARVDARDVLPILANQDTTPSRDAPALPNRARPSRRAWLLLNGKTLDRYPSRSEAEQALLTSLICAGQTFDDALSLFLKYPCAGKFAELYQKNPKRAVEWLRLSYESAARWQSTHEPQGRRIASAALQWAVNRAWNGHTGTIDRAVFIAHATIAQATGRQEYHASARALAELAQVGSMTATRATHRLIGAGLLEKTKAAVAAPTLPLANLYRLKSPADADKDLPRTDTLSTSPPVRECISTGISEAFWAGGLGKAAGQVYGELCRGDPSARSGLTVKELAERTGRGRETIRRAVKRMERIIDPETGEVVSIVYREGEKWRAQADVDLDHIAMLVGTRGKAARQRERHMRERRQFRERIKSQAQTRAERQPDDR